MKSSITGLCAILALAAIVAGHFIGLGVSIGVGVALAVVLGIGWPHYVQMPAKKTLGAVIAVTGAATALTAGLTRDANFLSWTPILIAAGFGAVMVVQLLRGTGQPNRLESTLGAGAGVLVAGCGGGWVASVRFLDSPGMTAIVAISAAVALLAGLLRWPDRVLAPLAIVGGALAGPLAALLFSGMRILLAAILGALVAAIIAAFRRLHTLASLPEVAPPAAPVGEAALVSAPAAVTAVPVADLTDGQAPAAAPAAIPAPVPAAAPAAAHAPAAHRAVPASSAGLSAILAAGSAAVAPIVALGALVYFVQKLLLT